MESKTYLNRYRVRLDANGAPVELRREASEVVYQAEDQTNGQRVALHVVSAAGVRMDELSKLNGDAASTQKFDHVNVPKILQSAVVEDQFVYATEYFDGTTAEEWVGQHGPMPAGAVLRIGLQVVSALAAAAFHGIVHRTINPRNLILVPGQTPEGDWPLIKLLNFNGVAPAPAVPVSAGSSLRHEDFASPEQLREGAVDFSSEIFSLGATLAFLLTGATSDAATALQNASGVPKVVKRLVGDMISPKSSDRPKDPLALQEAIRDSLAQVERRESIGRKFGIPVATTATVKVKEPVEVKPRRPWPVRQLAMAAAILAFLGLAALILPRTGLFRAGNEPIGVPIGVPVPENSPPLVAEATTIEEEAPPPVPSVPARDQLVAESNRNPEPETEPAPVSSPPAVVASTPAATPLPSVPAPAPEPVERETVLAANDPAPDQEFTEPPVPAEGPEETATPPEIPPVIAEAPEAAATPAQAPEPEREPVVAPARIENREERKVARQSANRPARTERTRRKSESRKVNVANTNQIRRALRNGSVRAEFLGTTPEGDLIFGLPTSERVYAAPPPASFEDERGRPQRVRRALPPVLPALPPDG